MNDLSATAGGRVAGSAGIDFEDESLDLRHYWRVVGAYKWRIVLFAMLIAVLAALVASSMTPIYRAQATMLIDPEQQQIVSIDEFYAPGSGNDQYYQTQFELLHSRQLAEGVVRRLDLASHSLVDPRQRDPDPAPQWRKWLRGYLEPYLPQLFEEPPPATAEQAHSAAVDYVLAHLSVTPVRNSQLVNITFESASAQLAAQVANTVALAYIEGQLEGRLEMTQQAASWLTERLDGLRQQLETSEQALQQYRERHRLVDVGGNVLNVNAAQLEKTTEQLVEARQERARTQTLYRQIQGVSADSAAALAAAPSVLQNPLIIELRGAESERQTRLSELSKRYGEKHPRMIQARSELESVQENIRREIAKVAESVRRQYEAAQQNEKQLEREFATRKNAVQDVNRKQYRLGVLEREVETNRQLYDMFLARFKESDAAEDLQTTNARVIDPAVAPSAPFKPRRQQIAALAFVLAFGFGIALALLRDYLDNTFKSSSDIEESLGLPVLGSIPHVRRKKRQDLARLPFEDQTSGFAESLRTLRTGVTLAGIDEPHRSLLVTSAVQGEGKTTVSVDLGQTFAQLEKVLLIDADLRAPAVSRTCGLDPGLAGLADIMADTAELDDCLVTVERSGLTVLPAGVKPPNPLELLSSQRFAKLLETCLARFDRVIIDAPPAQAVSDPLVLSRRVQGVLIVVRADSTPAPVVSAVVRRLRGHQAPLIGLALNQLNTKKGSQYGYGGYYGYSRYGYGYGR